MKGSSKGWWSIPAPTNAGCLSDLAPNGAAWHRKKEWNLVPGLSSTCGSLIGKTSLAASGRVQFSPLPIPLPLSLLPPSGSLPRVLPSNSFSLSLSPTLPLTLHLQLISFLLLPLLVKANWWLRSWDMQLMKVNPLQPRTRCRGSLEEESDGRMATSQPNSLPDNFVIWRYPYLTLSGFS